MKYWHPHLPFGQHISVTTLVIYIKKCYQIYKYNTYAIYIVYIFSSFISFDVSSIKAVKVVTRKQMCKHVYGKLKLFYILYCNFKAFVFVYGYNLGMFMFRFVEVAILSSFLLSWLITRVTRRLPLMKQELRTIPQHISFYCGVSVAQSLVFSVVFCRPLFDPMSYFVWPVYCMSFFDVCPRITPLISSNFCVKFT